ncbi:MAG: DNA repair protein RecO [Sterolibacterium sp.]|jgi:DNA repair protein RecO (recombination protein O)|nr:DNA repair protein RecO [Sterolibacterium sp.]
MSSGKQRIDGQQAYILHSHPYSETSLIFDVFSREHGRLPLLARGARRPRSALRGVLLAFQPLELGWFGGGEVRTLAKAEWIGGLPMLGGTALMLGYYLNELLLRLLPRDDAHPALFDRYAAALQALSDSTNANPGEMNADVHALLRRFEKHLLKELGYGLMLERDALSGQPIDGGRHYHYRIERGPVQLSADEENRGLADVLATHGMQAIRGKTLLDLACDDYADPHTLAESKLLMRLLINHHLAGKPLQSRRVYMELQAL